MVNPETPDRRFVVGYPEDQNPVYGSRSFETTGIRKRDRRSEDYCNRMTWWQAKRALKEMPDPKAQIYELVPVPEEK